MSGCPASATSLKSSQVERPTSTIPQTIAETMDKSDPDRNTIRGNWDRKCDFLLSAIGYCVGFGNVWRFPYLCYRNGGGAFLIPYFLMMVLTGIPLYFLELAIGQYGSLGPVAMWKLCPLFKGVGLMTVSVGIVVSLYYNILLAYVIFYLFASFTSSLPWASCNNSWNTPTCQEWSERGNNTTGIFGTNSTNTTMSLQGQEDKNITLAATNITKPRSPAEEYFERYMLDLSPGIDDLGVVRWQLVLCFLLAWIIIMACISKGIKSVGKVVYVTATFPYVIFTILLIRGLFLPGSIDGLRYYITPQWHRLRDPKVWGEGASQILFSLGPGWGGLFTYASYNKFHNNCLRDTFIASFVCSGTSLLAGSVIFSILGFMAFDLGVDISEVVSSGPGLVFVAYPSALARMPLSPLWAVLFFLMLLNVGLDSMFASVEMIVVVVCDAFPRLNRMRFGVILGVCATYFLLGLPMTTQAGFYIMAMLDWYCATFAFILVALSENVVIIYIYGYKKFAQDVEVMLGRRPGPYICICLSAIAPLLTSLVLIFNSIIHSPVTYKDYTYPKLADGIGLFVTVMPTLWVPGYMIYHYCCHVKSLKNLKDILSFPWTGETWRKLTTPDETWGPMMPQHRREAGLEKADAEHTEGLMAVERL